MGIIVKMMNRIYMNNNKHKEDIPYCRAFLAHAPISEHVLLLEYRRTEVNCNIDIDRRTFIFNHFSKFGFSATDACTLKHYYMVGLKQGVSMLYGSYCKQISGTIFAIRLIKL